MDPFFTPTHQALKAQVRVFAEEEVLPLVPEMEATQAIATDLSRKIAQQGWIGVTIPRRYGGMGMGHLAKTIIINETASDEHWLSHQQLRGRPPELGAGFYEEVGVQSRASFRLSLWLAAAGGMIFLLTVLASILISFFRGDSTAITWIGSIAAVLTEAMAAGNRLYNQASRQFADFQVDLDRINRSSISYAMVSEEAFEKKTEKQQEGILKVVETLLQTS